jgi:hypothetical protein
MTGRGARSPGQDLDADLRGRCRPHRAASRPPPPHHRWRPRSARPRSGRTARACAAAEARPGHYGDRSTSRRAVARCAARPARSPGGPQRSTTGNARRPGSGHRLSTERRVQRFAEAPNSRSPACAVTRPRSGHPTLDHQQRAAKRRGSRPGSLPRHLLMARRMTVMHGRSQPGAVSPTRTERRVGVRLSRAQDVVGCVAVPGHSPADSWLGCIFIHRRLRRELTILPQIGLFLA